MVCREQPAWRACAETSPCWPHRAAAALPIQVSRGSLSKGAAPGAWFHLAVAYAAVVSLPLLLSTPGPPESLSVRRCQTALCRCKVLSPARQYPLKGVIIDRRVTLGQTVQSNFN